MGLVSKAAAGHRVVVDPMSTRARSMRAVRDVRRCGYTLVELLVVAAIVSTLIVTTALALRTDPARSLESEAHRLAGGIELAHARARIAGEELALSVGADRYAFWQRDAAGLWHELGQDAGLPARALPPGIEVSALQRAGISIAHGDRIAIGGDADLPLAITLAGHGARARVASSVYFGRLDVRLLQRDE